ncbi:sporulation protein [Longirhabdus pacifica]|uniref:sporulation protein n=1 Tax=Longirhabdus pacifica TaxID=2305227 RepID=UPI0010088307|nr:sporulation protein [Longirhabdus pacifica]
MSFFKKALASVGIGSAKVDTKLHEAELYPGEWIEGEVHIIGGNIEQEIDDIYMFLETFYEKEVDDKNIKKTVRLHQHQISSRFTLQPDEEKQIPFSFQIPDDTPLTIGKQSVYLRTGLDIKNAIDPGDNDHLQIIPHPMMNKIISATEQLGFRLYKVDCEENRKLGRRFPFVQEFEFKPYGDYKKYLDELEMIFYLDGEQLEVLFEIDRRARGFFGILAEEFDMDERFARIIFHESDLLQRSTEDISYQLENIIDSQLK